MHTGAVWSMAVALPHSLSQRHMLQHLTAQAYAERQVLHMTRCAGGSTAATAMLVPQSGPLETTEDIWTGVMITHRAGLGQHCHRGGAGVHAPAGLGHRHALHAVDPALELEMGIDVAAADGRAGLLAAAALSL